MQTPLIGSTYEAHDDGRPFEKELTIVHGVYTLPDSLIDRALEKNGPIERMDPLLALDKVPHLFPQFFVPTCLEHIGIGEQEVVTRVHSAMAKHTHDFRMEDAGSKAPFVRWHQYDGCVVSHPKRSGGFQEWGFSRDEVQVLSARPIIIYDAAKAGSGWNTPPAETLQDLDSLDF